MAIYVDSCEAQETIVITTRSSIYELVFRRADRGDVLGTWRAVFHRI